MTVGNFVLNLYIFTFSRVWGVGFYRFSGVAEMFPRLAPPMTDTLLISKKPKDIIPQGF
ncbi:MAG UNVERIFIED_CONTAM: hypothetical protein LVR29_12940 [Microcystis novacekii LVE1205-3]|jgi:hypothetical protein